MATVDVPGPSSFDCDGMVVGIVSAAEAWPIPYTIVPLTIADARHARGPDTRLFAASASSLGSLMVKMYGDDDTASTQTFPEASGVTSSSLGVRSSGIVDILYAKSGDTFIRSSRDQAATWSSAQTVKTGYTLIVHWLDEASGLLVAMIYKDSDSSWYVTCGTLGSDGLTWTFSTPVSVVAAAKKPGQLRKMAGGPYTFSYVDGSNVLHIKACRSLASDGTGTWVTLAASVASGYRMVTHWHDDETGFLVLMGWKISDGKWYVFVGEWSTDGTSVTFASPVLVATGTEAAASIRRFWTGRWEFSVASSTGALVFLRNKNLSKTGGGTWA